MSSMSSMSFVSDMSPMTRPPVPSCHGLLLTPRAAPTHARAPTVLTPPPAAAAQGWMLKAFKIFRRKCQASHTTYSCNPYGESLLQL